MMKSAMVAKTPLEFADGVMRATMDEARANGFSDEQLEELKKKFEAARTHIVDYSQRSEAEYGEGRDRPSHRSDYGGPAAEDQPKGEHDADVPDSGG